MRARLNVKPTQLCMAVLAISAMAAQGQRPQVAQRDPVDQRDLLQWSGYVDREVQLVLHGQSVSVRNMGPSEPRNPESRLVNDVPRTDGSVAVDMVSGRGVVDVMQQPTSGNDYTAVVRVRDDAAGTSTYRFNIRWQPGLPVDLDPPYGRGGDPDGRGRGRDGRALARTALNWTGDVDEDIYIRFRTGSVTYSVVSGAPLHVISATLLGVPTGEVTLRITDFSGRGEASVAQQPMASNGYYAVIRIRDPQPSYGRYSFRVIW